MQNHSVMGMVMAMVMAMATAMGMGMGDGGWGMVNHDLQAAYLKIEKLIANSEMRIT